MRLKERMLLQSDPASGSLDDVNFQIYVWFPVFMMFVLFFAVSALFNMDVHRDSLLYAKFIATDNK